MSEAWGAAVVVGVILLLWKVQSLQSDVRSLKSQKGIGGDLTVHASKYLLEDRFGTLASRSATEPSVNVAACGRYLLPTKEERLEFQAIFTSDTDHPESSTPTCSTCADLMRAAKAAEG